MKNSIILMLVGSTLACAAGDDNKEASAVAGCLIISGVIGFKIALVKKIISK